MLQDTRPDVLVDFTNATVCMEAAMQGAAVSANLVLGASGLTDDNLQQLDAVAHDKNIGIVVAPNFALGAVVLKKLAEEAAAYFEYVDIIESHHEAKIDAPSGFAVALARSLGDRKEFTRNQTERENLTGSRGAEHNGVTVHSIRMPGRSAHHEVIFGGAGSDRIAAARHPGAGLLHARRPALHPRGCESSGSCGRLGERSRPVNQAKFTVQSDLRTDPIRPSPAGSRVCGDVPRRNPCKT